MNSKKIKLLGVSGVMLLLVFSVYRANTESFNEEDYTSLLRFPASMGLSEMHSLASQKVQKEFAETLAKLHNRKVASIGKPATELDNLRYGILEGKYALSLQGDRVAEISFVDNPGSSGSPMYIGDRFKFLSRFSTVLGVANAQPERVSVDVRDRHIVETYKTSEEKIEVILDDSDRLIGLRTEKLEGRKIF